ncbi:MAG: hypothetical protein VSS75_001430, partial [Candidatus Parabeggiatoa sp.]|nr:hypothetical protein [Candidatus Parabeggiatoa sp.]
MQDWMEKARKTAEKTYGYFLNQVVIEQVIKHDRIGLLPDKKREKLNNGDLADVRTVRLMSISGKGSDQYPQYTNITLLDHLLSVTRGSLLLAAMNWLSKNVDMAENLLTKKLAVIAATAFLHDLDKDLEQARRVVDIKPADVDERVKRYAIDAFLEKAGISLTSEQLLHLIEQVEDTQSYRHLTTPLPEGIGDELAHYVKLADKLDGIWLDSDPIKGGFNGVINRLERDNSRFDENSLLPHWQPVDIYDPHHPFLLDKLQLFLSLFSQTITGIPPLLEGHHDGRLYLLLPKSQFDLIVDKALNKLAEELPFGLEVDISNVGVPAILNGQPNHAELQALMLNKIKMSHDKLGKLLTMKAKYKVHLTQNLDDLLDIMGLNPRFPKTSSKQLMTLYDNLEDLDADAEEWIRYAAFLALMLNLKIDKGKTLTYEQRETALLETIQSERPAFINELDDQKSRCVVTALWAITLANENEALKEAIWEEDGLLQRWLEGSEDQIGFNQFMEMGDGDEIAQQVKAHFRALLSKQRVVPKDEKAKGRCLFTDEPTTFDNPINQASGLLGLKISAFSGRDHRPELLTSDKPHTVVSPVSMAEHKIRHDIQGGNKDSVPTWISSPSTLGLFGGLILNQKMSALSLFDMSRLETKKGTVLYGHETYQGRLRLAKLERLSEKTKDQVIQLRLLLTAARRTGRPFHVFRGLPTTQRAFFYYDAMPPLLKKLIGNNALRLEELPNALAQVELAQTFLEHNNLGYEVLNRYVTTETRFGAICLAWCMLNKEEKPSPAVIVAKKRLRDEYLNYSEVKMTKSDNALVELGKAAIKIQQSVRFDASTNEQMKVFNICLETMNALRKVPIPQDTPESLIYAIAGELEKGLKAKAKYDNHEKQFEACLQFAE